MSTTNPFALPYIRKTPLHSTEVNTDLSRYTTSKGFVYVQDIPEQEFVNNHFDITTPGDNDITKLANYMNEQRGGNFFKQKCGNKTQTHYVKYVSGGNGHGQNGQNCGGGGGGGGGGSSSGSSSGGSSSSSSRDRDGNEHDLAPMDDVCPCGCSIPMAEVERYRKRKRESRQHYSDGGTTTSSSSHNAILKQPEYWDNQTTRANVPIIHKGKTAEYIDGLKANKLLYFIMKQQDKLVKKAYPLLWSFIMKYVPKEYLLFEDLCFTYCAKTGGTNWGKYC